MSDKLDSYFAALEKKQEADPETPVNTGVAEFYDSLKGTPPPVGVHKDRKQEVIKAIQQGVTDARRPDDIYKLIGYARELLGENTQEGRMVVEGLQKIRGQMNGMVNAEYQRLYKEAADFGYVPQENTRSFAIDKERWRWQMAESNVINALNGNDQSFAGAGAALAAIQSLGQTALALGAETAGAIGDLIPESLKPDDFIMPFKSHPIGEATKDDPFFATAIWEYTKENALKAQTGEVPILARTLFDEEALRDIRENRVGGETAADILEHVIAPILEVANPVDVELVSAPLKAGAKVVGAADSSMRLIKWIDTAPLATEKLSRFQKFSSGLSDAFKNGVFRKGSDFLYEEANVVHRQAAEILAQTMPKEVLEQMTVSSKAIGDMYGGSPTLIGAASQTLVEYMKTGLGKTFGALPTGLQKEMMRHVPQVMNPMKWLEVPQAQIQRRVASVVRSEIDQVMARNASEIWDWMAKSVRLSNENGELLGRALTGQAQRTALPDEVLVLADEGKKRIYDMGRQLVDLGHLDKQVFEANQFTYMRQLYRHFLIGQEVKPLEAAFEAARRGEAAQKTLPKLQKQKPSVKTPEPNLLKQRVMFDDEIQDLLGKITDGAYSGSVTQLQMNKHLHTTLMQNAMAKLAKPSEAVVESVAKTAIIKPQQLVEFYSKRTDLFDEAAIAKMKESGDVPSTLVLAGGKRLDEAMFATREDFLDRIKTAKEQGNFERVVYSQPKLKYPDKFVDDNGVEWERISGPKFTLFNQEVSYFDDSPLDAMRKMGFVSQSAEPTKAGTVRLKDSFGLRHLTEDEAVGFIEEARKMGIVKAVDVEETAVEIMPKGKTAGPVVAEKKVFAPKVSIEAGKPSIRAGEKTVKIRQYSIDDFKTKGIGHRPVRIRFKDKVTLDEIKVSLKKEFPALGELEGKYLPTEVKKVMDDINFISDPTVVTPLVNFISPILKKAQGGFKTAKVALSPGTQVANNMANMFFANLAGMNWRGMPLAIADAAKDYRAMIKAGSETTEYAKLKRAGILGTSYLSPDRADLMQLLNVRADDFAAFLDSQKSWYRRLADSIESGKITKAAKTALVDFPRTVYEASDDLWKYATYKNLTQAQGLAPEIAINRIKSFMQDYARIPQMLKSLERGTGNVFMSFMYESMRIAKNSMYDSRAVWRMLSYPLIFYGVREAANRAWGVDEAMFEVSKNAGYGGIATFATPFKNVDGSPILADMSRWFPFSDLYNMGHEMTGDDIGWLRQKVMSGPYWGIAQAVLANKDVFTGREIYNEKADEPDEIRAKKIKYVLKTFSPNFLEGVIDPNSKNNPFKSVWGRVDRFGNEPIPWEYPMAQLGLRVIPTGDRAADTSIAKLNARVRAKMEQYWYASKDQSMDSEKKAEFMVRRLEEIKELIGEIDKIRSIGYGTIDVEKSVRKKSEKDAQTAVQKDIEKANKED